MRKSHNYAKMAQSSNSGSAMALTIVRSGMEWIPADELDDEGMLEVKEAPQWLVDLWTYVSDTMGVVDLLVNQCQKANISFEGRFGELAERVEMTKQGVINLFHHLQKGQEEINNLHAYNFKSLHKDCVELGSQVYMAISHVTQDLQRKEDYINQALGWMDNGLKETNAFYSDLANRVTTFEQHQTTFDQSVSAWATEKNKQLSEIQAREAHLEQELEAIKLNKVDLRVIDLTEAILRSNEERVSKGLSNNPKEVLEYAVEMERNQRSKTNPTKDTTMADDHFHSANVTPTAAQRWANREAQSTPLPPPPAGETLQLSNHQNQKDQDVEMTDVNPPPKRNRVVQWVMGDGLGKDPKQQHKPAYMHGAADNQFAPGGGAAGHHKPPTGGGGGKGGRNTGLGGDPDGSSSSSSSSDDSGNDFFSRWQKFNKQEKKDKRERHRRHRLLSRSVSPAPATVTQLVSKKPKMIAPKAYGGDRKEDFRVWLHQVKDYMEYCADEFTSDSVKILWLSGLLKEKALTWYQARRLALKKVNDEDSWATFRKALGKRFKDSFEGDRADDKMQKERYKGDISDYLSKMRTHNLKVGLSKVAWRRRLKAGVPDDIKLRLSLYHEDPEDDEDFEDRLEICGKNYEDNNEDLKLLGNSREQNVTTRKPTKPNRDSSRVSKNRRPSATSGGSRLRDGPPKPQFQKGKIIFNDVNEATRGVPAHVVDKRNK